MAIYFPQTTGQTLKLALAGALPLNDGWSAFGWINSTASTNWQTLLGHGASYNWALELVSNKLYYAITLYVDECASASTVGNTSRWYHVGFRHWADSSGNGQGQWFLNGKWDATGGARNSTHGWTDPLTIGGQYNGATESGKFKGYMAEWGLCRRPMKSGEFLRLYSGEHPEDVLGKDMLAYWPFKDDFRDYAPGRRYSLIGGTGVTFSSHGPVTRGRRLPRRKVYGLATAATPPATSIIPIVHHLKQQGICA